MKQWDILSNAKYIIGTVTGISHLHNLRGAIVVTNSNGLAVDCHLEGITYLHANDSN